MREGTNALETSLKGAAYPTQSHRLMAFSVLPNCDVWVLIDVVCVCVCVRVGVPCFFYFMKI